MSRAARTRAGISNSWVLSGWVEVIYCKKLIDWWTFCRYPLAVTRHKDSEVTSSSIYTQNDPWEPVVSFEDYIRNNEDIVNQVQWWTLIKTHTYIVHLGESQGTVVLSTVLVKVKTDMRLILKFLFLQIKSKQTNFLSRKRQLDHNEMSRLIMLTVMN